MFADTLVAQALLETAMVDNLISWLSTTATSILGSFEDHPWLGVALIALCLLLFFRRRR